MDRQQIKNQPNTFQLGQRTGTVRDEKLKPVIQLTCSQFAIEFRFYVSFSFTISFSNSMWNVFSISTRCWHFVEDSGWHLRWYLNNSFQFFTFISDILINLFFFVQKSVALGEFPWMVNNQFIFDRLFVQLENFPFFLCQLQKKNIHRLQSAIVMMTHLMIAVAQLSPNIIYWRLHIVRQRDDHQSKCDLEKWVCNSIYRRVK